MRIGLFPDDYLPNSTLVHAKMFHELAIELKRLGHHPVIVTPSHGYQSERLRRDTYQGIEVWRFRNPPMRGKSKVRRVISESLLSFNAYLALKNLSALESFDACINYSPTIFFGPLMHWFKKTQNTYNYLILRDMFPQWVIDEGLISDNSLAACYFRWFEKLNYRASDRIGLMSQANIDYFSKLHSKNHNVEILRNWADLKPFQTVQLSLDIRTEFNLQKKTIFFYGGNIGHAQDIANLLRLVVNMKCHKGAHFLFVGQGDQVDLVLQTKADKGLDNLTFLPSVSQDQYKELLTQVDVGLFSLAKTHKAHNFPGKLLGYMVQSLPILGSVNQGNDLIKFLNEQQAGIAYVNGDDKSLLDSALALLNSSELRKTLGTKGHKVLQDYFSVNAAASQLIESIEQGVK